MLIYFKIVMWNVSCSYCLNKERKHLESITSVRQNLLEMVVSAEIYLQISGRIYLHNLW